VGTCGRHRQLPAAAQRGRSCRGGLLGRTVARRISGGDVMFIETKDRRTRPRT